MWNAINFNLIELLVVIAIIGIFTSMLLPTVQKTQLGTMVSLCISNKKQIGTAFMSYATTYDDHFVYGLKIDPKDLTWSLPTDSKPPVEMLFSELSESFDFFICSSDPSSENFKFWNFADRPKFSGENARASYIFNE
ncbi:MAG: type II secretion system GspH family protein [Lentisphaerales bacterium]|nr:type II secretion system GspH family protein [Lentisphaerales bacterium]